MATRLYFPDGVAGPVTPPVPVGGTEWEHVNSSVNALLFYPDSSALNTVAYTPDAADDLTNRDSHHRQYVSDPLQAQTLAGNVTAQFQCLETFANDNLFLTMKLLVCSYNGATTQATLLAITRATSKELGTTIENRTFPSTALSSFACAAGDRLVIEVGVGGNITSGTGGVIGHNGSIRWGCSASSGDLPVDETTTGATFRAWIQFSQDFLFITPGVSVPLAAGLWSPQATPNPVPAAWG